MKVTQTIPDFLGGISQEPDYNKGPGFLKDVKNAYPDVTYGLQKRHGSRWEYDFDEDSTLEGGMWFSFRGANDIPYAGCIVPARSAPTARSASVRVWSSTTGEEKPVTGDFSYLEKQDKFPGAMPDKRAYKTTSINQVTVVLNRFCKVLEDTSTTDGSLTGTVTTVADLSDITPSNGDIYFITNGTSDLDDYYVKWEKPTDDDIGAWVETVKPGISRGIVDSTMPHALVQTASGFAFTTVSHVDREVGNEKTNQQPSFVNSYIENVFFYLNRVGLLSQNNVIMSQPLVPEAEPDELQSTNYYRVSTLTQSAADPIDLNASSVRPITLRSVQPTYQGIILFSDGEQFILYSEQGVITPQTSIIKSISTYEMYGDVNAIELGDEYYFLSRTLRHTRVFKMIPRGIEQAPQITEVTKIISDYIPNTIDTLVPNSQNGFISLSSSDDKFMYIYRTFIDNGEILFKSWYTWELPGKIKSCIFVRDRMYAITSQNGRHAVSSITLNTIPEEDILTNIQQQAEFANYIYSIGPYLDFWIGEERFDITYTSQTTNSQGQIIVTDPIVELPTNFPSSIAGLSPCAVQSVDKLSRSLDRSQLSEVGTGAIFPVEEDNGKWVIKGTFELSQRPNFVVGYRYAYDLFLPDYYLRADAGADFSAFLNIDRYRFNFKDASAEIQFLIQSWGRNSMRAADNDWTVIKPSPEPRYYDLDRSPVYQEVEFLVPIHQRNTNFRMRIYSDSPFPVTLNKLMWEGNYNPRYIGESDGKGKRNS